MIKTIMRIIAFYLVAILVTFVSIWMLESIPELLYYFDFVASGIATLFLGVAYYFFGKNRRITLIFCGYIRIAYMCVLTFFIRKKIGISDEAAVIRCFLASINIIILLVGVGILFGKLLGIMPVRVEQKNERENR